MDLNPFPPANWTLSDGPFELADYALSSDEDKPRTDTLLLLNAWLLHGDANLNKPWDWRTANYWAARLHPLWRDVHNSDANIQAFRKDEKMRSDEDSSSGHKSTVIICNRCGEENGKRYYHGLYACSNVTS